MKKMVPLSQLAEIGSGTAIKRESGRAFAVMVSDVGSGRFVSRSLASVAELPSSDDLRLRDGDLLISLRGKRNGASIFRADWFGDAPVYASLDLAVIRVQSRDGDIIQALWVWLNLDATQLRLAKFRMGSHALRLPLPALRDLRVPDFKPSRAATLHRAEAAMRKVRRIETQIVERRHAMFEAMLKQVAETAR